jgi:Tfp pilus assembly protein PilX
MNESKGFCPKCDAGYNSWALANLTNQECSRCGSDLEISGKGAFIGGSYSSGAIGTSKAVQDWRKRYGGGSTNIN